VYMCIMLFYPALAVWAVGLGDLTVRSSLNMPLEAEINILSVDQIAIGEFEVSLALTKEFESAGIPQVSQLGGLTFTPTLRDDGGSIVVITSSEPISEPYLNFLVAIEWSTGRIVREYTALIDPPVYGETTPARIIGPEIPSFALTASSTKRAGLSLDMKDQSWSYGPVERGNYLIAIAKIIEVPDSVSIYQLLYGLFLNNSHGFINRNMNLLKAGVVLDIPDIDVLEDISRVAAMETFTRHVIEWQEYRARFVNLGDTKDQLEERVAGMGLMQETVDELEREILNLRTELNESNADNLRQGRKLSEATDDRNKLLDDISRLQNARVELLETMSSDLVEMEAPNIVSLDTKNMELQSQVRLLEGRIAEAMALIKAQDEELAAARQQVAVYGAALEALESVEANAVSGTPQNKPSEQSVKVDAPLPAPSEKEEAVQTVVSDPAEGLQDASFLVRAYRESRLVFLAAFVAIVLLLMLFMLLRLRRVARLRADQETSNIIVSDSSTSLDSGLDKEIGTMGIENEIGSTSTEKFSDSSGMTTKLDLARAYYEMGNHQMARELLKEVEDNGEPADQYEARALKEHLGL